MSNESKISIKVTVDKQKNKVVYAEADHTFVDVLFSFMTLPLASIVRLLNKQSYKRNMEAFKSINNLYQSLVNLPDCFFFNEECKYSILNPRSPSYDLCRKLKVNIDDTESKKYFVCQSSYCIQYNTKFSNVCNARCDTCGAKINREIPFKDIDTCDGGGVFVSDVSTFIVTDDLRVMPYTPGCCIQLLIDLEVTDSSHIEEKTVDLGYQQIIDLLGLSLSCNSPLTYLVLYPSRDLIISQHGIFDHCTSFDEIEEPKLFLHVFLQKSTKKFLFGEAEGDFVDFISGFFAISLGTVIGQLMSGNSSLVCMDNLYKSISDINVTYFRAIYMKDILLKTHFGQQYSTKNQFFLLSCSEFPRIRLDKNSSDNDKVNSDSFLSYSFPGLTMDLNDPRVGKELLKCSGMFMLTDDLVITSSSTISPMNILSKCNVPLKDIERHKVSIGLKEGIRMLKASMISSTLSKGLEHQLKILKLST
ncbi:uncharacterized protein [Rutidosis leptorrhynchoides]|uniref:uncharacterized protein n=1 Tax=Rutidosis leptorrhynchoides TaxID=125765 RepID=UPI003A9956DD